MFSFQLRIGEYGLVDNSGLKLKLKRGKTKVKPTRTTPFCLIDVKGNISKCAGCRGNLRDGPADGKDDLDAKVCIRHKERDFVWIHQRGELIQKFDNRHYQTQEPAFSQKTLILTVMMFRFTFWKCNK